MSKTKEENAIIETPAKDIIHVDSYYDRVIEMAIESTDLEKIEKFMDLKERHEANEARKAFHLAMSKFKADPPEIDKDSLVGYKNKDGSFTGYKHASLGNVSAKINKALSEHGLSASWKTDQQEGKIKVTCTITHEFGFFESTSLFAPPDTSGKKNSIQAIGSVITYLQRYTILSLTGLATMNQDGDGLQPEEIIYVDEKQISQLADMLLAIEKTETEYCQFKKVESLKDIPKSWFDGCVADLKPKES